MTRSSILLLITFALLSCTSYESPDSAIDCGRQFINATYQGNFKRAKQLLVPTPQNLQVLENDIEKDFRSRDGFGKEKLSKSSIVINGVENQGDTATFIKYINAYNNKPTSIKCVLVNGEWKADLIVSTGN